MDISQRIKNALEYIYQKVGASPKVGLILGSGLDGFSNELSNAVSIPYSDIPNFPLTTVEGHEGAFVFGTYKGKSVVALKGRIHYYEGYTQQEITMSVRIMKKLGVETLILTNAAGGVNKDFSAGSLMLISDHINYSGSNPLIGANLDEFGPRFPDMSEVYTKELRDKIKSVAKEHNIKLEEGVYAMYSGPSYETPAEVRMFRILGADAVGMSTVPEAIIASHSGISVLGISCITNMAAGILDQKLDHGEVVEAANKVKKDFTNLIKSAIEIC